MTMTEILIKYILPFVFMLGYVMIGFKIYFHFKYLKIIENYPKDLKLLQIGGYNFFDLFVIILPFFWRFRVDKIPRDQINTCKKLEKLINICLTLFYLGILSMILGIRLQNG
jgi:hypothetical protein